MSRETVIICTLIAYKFILLGIGLFAGSRTKDSEDFFLGGRNLGPIVAAISASASSSSAWTLLGVSGFAFSRGLVAVWLFPICVGGFALNWYVIAPAIRRSKLAGESVTLTGILAGPKPKTGRDTYRSILIVLASLITVVFFTIYIAAQFQAAGKAFEEYFPAMNAESGVLIGCAVVLLYTLIGGFWAVSLSDTLQGGMMALTAVVLPLATFWILGPSDFWSGLQNVNVPGFGSIFGGKGFGAFAWLVFGLAGIALAYPGQPHVVNRFMALEKDPRALVKARRIAMGWAIIVYSGMILLGLCGRILIDGQIDAEKIFFMMAEENLPAVISGVMVAAVLSAIMSTADSQLLVAASALTHDLGLGGKNEKTLMIRSRVIVTLVCFAALAVVFGGDSTIFERVLFAFSAMGAAFGPLLFVMLLRGPVRSGAKLLAMATGLMATVLAKFPQLEGQPYQIVCERVVPILLALAIAYWGSKPSAESQQSETEAAAES